MIRLLVKNLKAARLRLRPPARLMVPGRSLHGFFNCHVLWSYSNSCSYSYSCSPLFEEKQE